MKVEIKNCMFKCILRNHFGSIKVVKDKYYVLVFTSFEFREYCKDGSVNFIDNEKDKVDKSKTNSNIVDSATDFYILVPIINVNIEALDMSLVPQKNYDLSIMVRRFIYNGKPCGNVMILTLLNQRVAFSLFPAPRI